jgi:hypothetical protein
MTGRPRKPPGDRPPDDRAEAASPPAPRGNSVIPKGAGALKTRPGYEVGYARPPSSTQFQPGASGNPRGRPKGSRNKLPALNEERMKSIIIEEAYRTIKVRDGTRNVSVPIARAVLRSLSVNAVKGQHRSQRLFAELLAAVETSFKAHNDDWVKTAIEYKVDWEQELFRRQALGITHLPDPVPHPDQVVIDFNRCTARIIGPMTKQEKVKWDTVIARKQEYEENIRELRAELRQTTSPRRREVLEMEIHYDQQYVDLVGKMERGEPITRFVPYEKRQTVTGQKGKA